MRLHTCECVVPVCACVCDYCACVCACVCVGVCLFDCGAQQEPSKMRACRERKVYCTIFSREAHTQRDNTHAHTHTLACSFYHTSNENICLSFLPCQVFWQLAKIVGKFRRKPTTTTRRCRDNFGDLRCQQRQQQHTLAHAHICALKNG